MIAGLEETSAGTIRFDGEPVDHLPPRWRNIAMVFQSYALYPHMTVAANMAFGLRMQKVPRAEIADAVKRAAKLLGIEELLDRKPRELSGGQRQRVAMGRAIVRNPKVFLFDEPLSNLDAALRVGMRVEIKKLHRRLKTTIVYVTHDQIEAMTLADRIVVMNGGRIEQVGAPMAVYDRPVNRFVAGFIGSPRMNFLNCTVHAADGRLGLALPNGQRLPLPADRAKACGAYLDQPMVLGIRPQHLTEADPGADGNPLDIIVDVVEPTGAEQLVGFVLDGIEYFGMGRPNRVKQPGQPIRLYADMAHMHLFRPDDGLAVT
jgi:multiple sugar transport system ATP-binding protein